MSEPAAKEPPQHGEIAAPSDGNGHGHAFPRPVVKKMRWPYPLIWVFPIAAAIALGVYLYQHHRDQGQQISVTFNDADGIRSDETLVEFRGVVVGKVSGVRLSDDHAHAVVDIRLHSPDDSIAKTGALFWIVRPEISTESIAGLGTLVTGPYIQVIPGAGKTETSFTGLEKQPHTSDEAGLWLTLNLAQADQLQSDSPVYYRGIRVGTVEDLQMGADASHVDAHVVIYGRYRPLVRQGSKFWKVAGADVTGGVFTGLEVKVNSLQALLTGGVAFATPDDAGLPARDGDVFLVYPESKKEWLAWAPKIPIPPAGNDGLDVKNGKMNHGSHDALKNAVEGSKQSQF